MLHGSGVSYSSEQSICSRSLAQLPPSTRLHFSRQCQCFLGKRPTLTCTSSSSSTPLTPPFLPTHTETAEFIPTLPPSFSRTPIPTTTPTPTPACTTATTSTPNPASPPASAASPRKAFQASRTPKLYPWLIVGIGNPGSKFQKTRHNAKQQTIAASVDSNHQSQQHKMVMVCWRRLHVRRRLRGSAPLLWNDYVRDEHGRQLGERTHIDWARWAAGPASSFALWTESSYVDTEIMALDSGIRRGIAACMVELDEAFPDVWQQIGFEMIDAIAQAEGIKLNTIQQRALTGKGLIGSTQVLLAKPQTYVNLTGESVGPLAAYYRIPVQQILVIYDDTELEFGLMRLQTKGGPTTNNGVKSVIDHLKGCRSFPRLRIGNLVDMYKEFL
ncbi:hypothetical protein L7F22_000872 [Adiantum nelumboides]|nr:hypothetical protein [Adiantum nelumboides]